MCPNSEAFRITSGEAGEVGTLGPCAGAGLWRVLHTTLRVSAGGAESF